MKPKNYIIINFFLLISISLFAQSGTQKRADNLFNKFSFVNAAKVYHELINNEYNINYATRQLADSYAYMRNPEDAVIYYKKAVQQDNIPIEYYYNYAQALRGIKNYKESRVWLEKFKNAGGIIKTDRFTKDSDFITSIFNAKPQYFLTEVNFNSKYSDFGAYEHDGNIYFVSSRNKGVSIKHTYGWNKEPFLDIYAAKKNETNNNVTYKSKLKGDINSMYHDGPITMTKDGKTIYFSRNNFNKNILGKDKKGFTNLKIYQASLVKGKWINIKELPFNNNDYSNGHPALNEDENKLYFTSNMPGGIGGSDIYYVEINKDGTFGSPQNLGEIINTTKNERFPFINSEGSLFFSSDGHPGLGLFDIFGTVADKNNNIISVINLGVPVNSSKDDFSFFMNNDGLSGYFASNRNGGIGGDDIYAYDRIPQLKIEGTVKDAILNTPLVNVIVTLLDGNNKKIATLKTDKDGYYEINIDRDSYYKVDVKKDSYTTESKMVNSKNIERNITSITTNFVLDPDKIEEEEELISMTKPSPIYFDYNKSNINTNSSIELDKVIHLMQTKYPNMLIKIESHTDSRGSASYNNNLSIKRATNTYKYLLSKGLNPERIIEHKGYGEQNLVNDCDDTSTCTEEQHQLNRRTQLIVVRMD
ncbi:flagellar motor protein MotB [Flavivirga aquatica]|uniref:Flagellar motor protein MotB n=1 Tax=Flavivirga aquatica TaxID=1849968 RepID=A0A1E5TAK8_9FLAO|nr:OmpA family protein [Flavivirga aquatica]OEK08388.1 flagellar motor protein MotB [Flavivirga aquatica]